MIDKLYQYGGGRIKINIVGILSSPEEVHQVEKIARIFVIEERLRNLNYPLNPEEVIKNIKSEDLQKQVLPLNKFHNISPVLTVHGLS